MRVSKWVDFGTEVEVLIDANDVRAAVREAWDRVTMDRLGEDGPTRAEVLRTLNDTGVFLKAITDDQIQDMTSAQRQTIWAFLLQQAERYEPKEAIKQLQQDVAEGA